MQRAVVPTPDEKHGTSPPYKDAPNPQQGMSDHAAASVSAKNVSAVTNTPCTSPLTVTSLEAAAAARGESAGAVTVGNLVPQVVAKVVPEQQPEPVPVETMLSVPMDNLALDPAPLTAVAPAPIQMEQTRIGFHFQRKPPTEHDPRKLFVGGLPSRVRDHDFLNYFMKFGEVVDSVVMVDRMTKRSRGFGFVTFANENDVKSLLNAIPGEPKYVLIYDKPCEVKVSTPKIKDGSSKHGHHGMGMWQSHHRRPDIRGYSSRHLDNAPRLGPIKHTIHHKQPRDAKHFDTDSRFKGDVDPRNFDALHPQQPQMRTRHQPMHAYGRNLGTYNPSMHHQNYQNLYPTAAANGYVYPGSPGTSVNSSWEQLHPSSQYAPAMPRNGGFYDPFSTQYYPNQYSSRHVEGFMPPSMMMEQTACANNNNNNADGEASVYSQGVGASDGGFGPDPQSHQDDEDHGQAVDPYE